jgi:O-antigen biosynthesis protein
MTISVVIPHYGRHELIQGCLAALWKHTALEVEVVVVDNGTGHDIDADIVIRNQENLGFAKASNQGAAAAGGDMLVFLNNDCEVRDGWLEPLVARIDAGAGIVGSLLLYPDGQVQHAGVRLYRNDRGELTAENRRQHYAAISVEAVTGACMAIRRDVFFDLGGFDEGFRNGYEDISLCLTARQAGLSVIYEPASVVTHHESASGPERWAHVRANIARLQELWSEVCGAR